MKRKVIIAILFTLIAVGGKMLPHEVLTAPISQLGGSTSKLRDETDGLSLVTRIVDGDTIIVEVNGVQEKIRLIGTDTPEVVDPRKPVQCFGKEASAFTKNLLAGGSVRLESDPTQGDRDKYGRLLRYVFLSDGTFVNKTLIAEGYAHEYTYRIPYRYQTDFKTAERSARENKKGLWVPGACVPK